MSRFVSVAVPVPALGALTYRLPEELGPVFKGSRVLVPLGTRIVTGCVIDPAAREPESVAPEIQAFGSAIPQPSSPWGKSGVAPRPAMRPAGKARRPRISGIFEGGATQPAGMQRRPNAAGLAPRAAKDVVDVLDVAPFLTEEVVGLVLWVAEYYAAGVGETIAAAMPPFARVESERQVRITDEGRARLQAGDVRDAHAAILRALAGGTPSSIGALSRALATDEALPMRRTRNRQSARLQPAGLHAHLTAMVREGLVCIEQPLKGKANAFKKISVASLTVQGSEFAEVSDRLTADDRSHAGVAAVATKPTLRSRQLEALRILQGAPEGIACSILGTRGISRSTLASLGSRGLITITRVTVERSPFAGSSPFSIAAGRENAVSPVAAGLQACGTENTLSPVAAGTENTRSPVAAGSENTLSPVAAGLQACGIAPPAQPHISLTIEQDAAVRRLSALAAQGAFHAVLLHGVTGSGKTEVYLRVARRVTEARRTVLVLVPEIALTPAIAETFRRTFGDRVAIQHSGLSDGERHDQWHRIRRGDVDVVVGTRSAVFAPLQHLGLVIVDEEHDGSYKQEESPRYHARDVAVVRAKRAGALVLLGSATPSMETYQNALARRYERITLERRVLERPLAEVKIVDMREEYAEEGPDVILSRALREAMAERLERRDQVLILLNRRGYATAVFCRQCAGTVECPNCSVTLTVHRADRRARCHYCNYSMGVPRTCPLCGGPYLEQVGFGTERVEATVKELFPQARSGRVDRDSVRRRGSLSGVLARFGRRELDVLIGTQMIAKGHDFPDVTLVGVISADVGLGMADFRAAERTFQLLTQVAGRAGRGEKPGEAIIQTLYPNHYSIRHACRQDYAAFFEEEIKFRREMQYPPRVALVNAIVRAKTAAAALQEAADIVRLLRAGAPSYRVLGPAPAPIGKLRGEHRAQLFMKGTHRPAMRETLRQVLSTQPEQLRRRVTIDVDPLSVL